MKSHDIEIWLSEMASISEFLGGYHFVVAISMLNMGVSKNNGTPESSISIGFSIIFTIHFGVPLFLETPICTY